MKPKKPQLQTIRLLENIALGSAVFAAILCILLILNFLQLKRADPLNTPALKAMNERLQGDPGNDQLREEIRTLDLLARKAYFTAQWQVRTGGYLLFISILLLVSCVKAVELMRSKLPEEPGSQPVFFWETRLLRRRWLIYTGIVLAVTAFILGFLTHRELGNGVSSEVAKWRSSEIMNSAIDQQPATSNQQPATTDHQPPSTDHQPATTVHQPPSWKDYTNNFPSFRGPGNIGITARTGIPTSWDGKSGKNILWKTAIPLPGYNSPVIWGTKLYLSGASESRREVYCLDATSGKIVWKTALDKVPGTPGKVPGVSKETGLAAPTLATDGMRVYAVFPNGDLAALDTAGNIVWSKNLGMPDNHYGHSSSLILYRDILIIQYDQRNNPAVMGLSAKTGEQIWKTTRNVKISWASPSLVYNGKRMELLLSAEPCVAAYDPSSGKELWKIDCISGEVGPSLAYANGIVFAVNEYSSLYAIQAGETPKILWENSDFLSDVPSPVATDQYLFLVTSYGTAVCYDAKTGTKYWEHDFGNPVYSSPMLAEGRLYIQNKQGVMFIVKADKEFKLISQANLGENSFCTPVFTNGHIFIRADKNLYCIGK
jgi:outer membrane protein assembly factor BamB